MKTRIYAFVAAPMLLVGTASAGAQGFGDVEEQDGKPPPCRSDCVVGYGDGVNLAIQDASNKLFEYGCSEGRRGSPKQFKRWITKSTDGRVRVQINYECTGDD